MPTGSWLGVSLVGTKNVLTWLDADAGFRIIDRNNLTVSLIP